MVEPTRTPIRVGHCCTCENADTCTNAGGDHQKGSRLKSRGHRPSDPPASVRANPLAFSLSRQREHAGVHKPKQGASSSKKPCAQSDRVRQDLIDRGFARFEREFLNTSPGDRLALLHIRQIAQAMPLDRDAKGHGRARLYGRATKLAHDGERYTLHYHRGRHYEHFDRTGLEYTQPACVNSEAAGERRLFGAFPEELYLNHLVERWVRQLFDLLPIGNDERREEWRVGLHLLRLEPDAEHPATASPNRVRRDGEPFTAAVLIDRIGVEGGINAITHVRWHDHARENVPSSDLFSEFTLENPFEGYIVADERVAHYVGPVCRQNAGMDGNRTVLLIDFTRLGPILNLAGIEATEGTT